MTHASLGAYAAAKNFSHGVTQNSRVFVASAVSFDPQVSFTSYLPLAAFLASAPNPLRCRDAQLKSFHGHSSHVGFVVCRLATLSPRSPPAPLCVPHPATPPAHA